VAGCPLPAPIVDFHALRHTFISGMAAAGVHPKVAQTLARHSTITLTMDRYSHVSLLDVAGALEHLPGLPADRQEQRATGTDDATAEVASASGSASEGAKRAYLAATPCNDGAEAGPPAYAESPEGNAVFSKNLGVRLLGLEPRTYGLKVPGDVGVRGIGGKDLHAIEKDVVPTVVPCNSNEAPQVVETGRSPDLPADLCRVVDAWPELPEALKAGILAMIHAATAMRS